MKLAEKIAGECHPVRKLRDILYDWRASSAIDPRNEYNMLVKAIDDLRTLNNKVRRLAGFNPIHVKEEANDGEL